MRLTRLIYPLLFTFLLTSCNQESGEKSLRIAYMNHFPVGAAIGQKHLAEYDTVLLEKHFASITAENDMKPSRILGDEPGEYTFGRGDAIVEFAEKHNMLVRGHTLTWYNQTPDWFFRNGDNELLNKEAMLDRHSVYIHNVLDHYRDRVYCWDVVNEAISDYDSLVYRDDIDWYRICGPEYIEHAFVVARDVDPGVKLFYNDYNLINPNKARKVYEMAKDFIDRGIPIDGIGMQGHWTMEDVNAENLAASIDLFASLGLEVHITELDLSVYPFYHNKDRSTLPKEVKAFTPELEARQAEKYREIFDVLREKSDVVTSVTFWGVADDKTWLSDYFVRGRTDYPLLFDRDFQPKEAFDAIIR